MLWPKALPLDLDFGLCARAKLFNTCFLGPLKCYKVINMINISILFAFWGCQMLWLGHSKFEKVTPKWVKSNAWREERRRASGVNNGQLFLQMPSRVAHASLDQNTKEAADQF